MSYHNGYISKAVAWISTAIAISVGIYCTQNPFCLLALFFPMTESMFVMENNNGGEQ